MALPEALWVRMGEVIFRWAEIGSRRLEYAAAAESEGEWENGYLLKDGFSREGFRPKNGWIPALFLFHPGDEIKPNPDLPAML